MHNDETTSVRIRRATRLMLEEICVLHDRKCPAELHQIVLAEYDRLRLGSYKDRKARARVGRTAPPPGPVGR